MRRLNKVSRLLRYPSTWPALFTTLTAASVEHAEMLRHLAPATVLDVGANKGQFTLVVRAVAPKANVLAFEPLASEAATFKRNHGRDPLVTLYPFALSDRSGTATFHVTNRADSSSLLMPAANAKKAYEVSTTHAISVDVGRLDELVGVDALVPPVLLKLDVQGAEAMVLEGATGLLDKIDYVFTEVSFVPLYEGQALASDILKLIHSRGYALRGVYSPSQTKAFGATQANLLFEKSG